MRTAETLALASLILAALSAGARAEPFLGAAIVGTPCVIWTRTDSSSASVVPGARHSTIRSGRSDVRCRPSVSARSRIASVAISRMRASG